MAETARDRMLKKKRGDWSELYKAQMKQGQGEKLNFCPFGCRGEDLTDHGYCQHLRGFTNDTKTLEPMVPMVGARGEPNGLLVVDGSVPEKVLPTDKLVRITSSYRVYRDTKAKG